MWRSDRALNSLALELGQRAGNQAWPEECEWHGVTPAPVTGWGTVPTGTFPTPGYRPVPTSPDMSPEPPLLGFILSPGMGVDLPLQPSSPTPSTPAAWAADEHKRPSVPAAIAGRSPGFHSQHDKTKTEALKNYDIP